MRFFQALVDRIKSLQSLPSPSSENQATPAPATGARTKAVNLGSMGQNLVSSLFGTSALVEAQRKK
jgi:hypothetical protein